MDIRKEQRFVLQKAAGEEDLRLINALSKSELTAEQVYIFAVKLCDNEIDRDFERFDIPALKSLQQLFIGKSGIFDHQWSAAGQTARIYKTELCEEAGKLTAANEPYRYLKGYAYMLRHEKNGALIEEIEGGIKKEVSVGCSVRRSVCSICGKEIGGADCPHRKGVSYAGKLCHAILQEPTDAYEWSFVAVPAQRSAGVMKKGFDAGEGLQKFTEQPDGAPFAEELRTLKKLACLGERYLSELREDVLRLSLMTEKGLAAETFRAITAKLTAEELRELQKVCRERAAALYPMEPQLRRREKSEDAKDEGAFLV